MRVNFDGASCGGMGFCVQGPEVVVGQIISEVWESKIKTEVKNGFPGPNTLRNTYKKYLNRLFFFFFFFFFFFLKE